MSESQKGQTLAPEVKKARDEIERSLEALLSKVQAKHKTAARAAILASIDRAVAW